MEKSQNSEDSNLVIDSNMEQQGDAVSLKEKDKISSGGKAEWISMTIGFFAVALIMNMIEYKGASIAYCVGGATGFTLIALFVVFIITRFLKEKFISVLLGALICYFLDSGRIYSMARDQGLSPAEANQLKNIYFIIMIAMFLGFYWVTKIILKAVFKSNKQAKEIT